MLTGILAHAFEPAGGAATGGAENPWQLDASPSMATPTQTQTERALKVCSGSAAPPRACVDSQSAIHTVNSPSPTGYARPRGRAHVQPYFILVRWFVWSRAVVPACSTLYLWHLAGAMAA